MLIATFSIPETYHPVLLARKAATLRNSTGNGHYYSASERENAAKSISQTVLRSLYRPFQLLFLEPMCTCLCLYSALLLGILYLFFGAFPLVFSTNHDFEQWQIGLTFLGLIAGQLAALSSNNFWSWNYQRLIAKAKKEAGKGNENFKPDPEFRLPSAIAAGVLVPIGLFCEQPSN